MSKINLSVNFAHYIVFSCVCVYVYIYIYIYTLFCQPFSSGESRLADFPLSLLLLFVDCSVHPFETGLFISSLTQSHQVFLGYPVSLHQPPLTYRISTNCHVFFIQYVQAILICPFDKHNGSSPSETCPVLCDIELYRWLIMLQMFIFHIIVCSSLRLRCINCWDDTEAQLASLECDLCSLPVCLSQW